MVPLYPEVGGVWTGLKWSECRGSPQTFLAEKLCVWEASLAVQSEDWEPWGWQACLGRGQRPEPGIVLAGGGIGPQPAFCGEAAVEQKARCSPVRV